MKRELQLAIVIGISITSAVAQAGGGGVKFGGGGISIGGGNGGSRPNMQFNNNASNSARSISGNPGGGIHLNPQIGSSGGIQIQKKPEIRIGVQNGNQSSGLGITLGNKLPPNILKGNGNTGIVPHTSGAKVGINLGGNSPIVNQIGKQIGGQIGNQIGNKIGKIDPGFGQAIDKHIGIGGCKIGDKVCDSHCKPGCKPHCPTIWWYSPCYKPCHTTTVVQQTIVVQVPVAVAGTPAPLTEALMQIPVGSTVTLQGQTAPEVGQVILQIEKVSMPVQVNDWKPEGITITLPMLGLEGPVRAQVWMVNADGTLAGTVAVELIAAQPTTDVAQASAVEGLQDVDAAATLFGSAQ